MAADLAIAGIREVRRFVPEIVDVADLAEPALILARELDHSVYDCVYIALAHRRGAPLVTLDQGLTTRVAKTRYRTSVVHLADWE
jgi:predicted nucleic acid-binding protein